LFLLFLRNRASYTSIHQHFFGVTPSTAVDEQEDIHAFLF